jgi:hypothetical protein
MLSEDNRGNKKQKEQGKKKEQCGGLKSSAKCKNHARLRSKPNG